MLWLRLSNRSHRLAGLRCILEELAVTNPNFLTSRINLLVGKIGKYYTFDDADCAFFPNSTWLLVQ